MRKMAPTKVKKFLKVTWLVSGGDEIQTQN